MKKRFNNFREPKGFQSYMSYLEDEVMRLGINNNYKKLSHSLINNWRIESDSKTRDDIRNYLVMTNIKLAHEILLKELKPDFRKDDVLDMLQDINLGLVEIVEEFLKDDGNYEDFSSYLFKKLKRKLNKIAKDYYDHNKIEFSDSEFIEELEDQKNSISTWMYKETRNKRLSICLNSFCREREKLIIKEYFLTPQWTMEEIGCRWGLTRERVRQIIEKGLDRIRTNYYRSDPIGYTGYTYYPEEESYCSCYSSKKGGTLIVRDIELGNKASKLGVKYYITPEFPTKTIIDQGVDPKDFVIIKTDIGRNINLPYDQVFNSIFMEQFKKRGCILKHLKYDVFKVVDPFLEPFRLYPEKILQDERYFPSLSCDITTYFENLNNWTPVGKPRGREKKYSQLTGNEIKDELRKLYILREYAQRG